MIMGGNPRKLTIALLSTLFTPKQLAHGKAKGQRKAHNAKEESRALSSTVLSAIKEFVLNKFKNSSGEPFLTEKEFTEIINAKCGTARRALKN